MTKIGNSKVLTHREPLASAGFGSTIWRVLRAYGDIMLLGIIILLSAIWYTYKLENPPVGTIEYDEGLKLMVAKTVAMGYKLYTQVFTDNSPLFIGTLATYIRIFGTNPVYTRSVMVTFGLLGIIGVYLLGRQLAGRTTGLLSAIFLALSYRWFEYSRLVMEEIPSATFQVFTVFALLKCLNAEQERQELSWALLTGLFMTSSALMKTFSTFNFFLLLPIFVYFKRSRKLLLAFFIGWAIPLTVFLPLDIKEAFMQIVLHPLSRPSTTNLPKNWDILRTFIWPFWPYNENDRIIIASWPEGNTSLLAVIGIIYAIVSGRRDHRIVAGWAIYQGIYLIVWTSLYFHHCVLILPLLPVLAAYSTSHLKNAYVIVRDGLKDLLSGGYAALRRLIAQRRQFVKFILMGIFLVAEIVLLVGYTARIPRILEKDLELTEVWYAVGLKHEVSPEIWEEATALIQKYSTPSDWVISDAPNIIYLANRTIVPELCDSSHMRIRSGFLNSEDAIELTEQYNVKVVVVWARRLQRLTVFLDYVEANFTLIWEHKPENESIRQIYVREIT